MSETDETKLTVEMTEEELNGILDKIDKWNMHVRNLVKDLCDRARLQINTGEQTPDEAYGFLKDQLNYHYGHNREILQNMVSLAMRGGKVRRFQDGS